MDCTEVNDRDLVIAAREKKKRATIAAKHANNCVKLGHERMAKGKMHKSARDLLYKAAYSWGLSSTLDKSCEFGTVNPGNVAD